MFLFPHTRTQIAVYRETKTLRFKKDRKWNLCFTQRGAKSHFLTEESGMWNFNSMKFLPTKALSSMLCISIFHFLQLEVSFLLANISKSNTSLKLGYSHFSKNHTICPYIFIPIIKKVILKFLHFLLKTF